MIYSKELLLNDLFLTLEIDNIEENKLNELIEQVSNNMLYVHDITSDSFIISTSQYDFLVEKENVEVKKKKFLLRSNIKFLNQYNLNRNYTKYSNNNRAVIKCLNIVIEVYKNKKFQGFITSKYNKPKKSSKISKTFLIDAMSIDQVYSIYLDASKIFDNKKKVDHCNLVLYQAIKDSQKEIVNQKKLYNELFFEKTDPKVTSFVEYIKNKSFNNELLNIHNKNDKLKFLLAYLEKNKNKKTLVLIDNSSIVNVISELYKNNIKAVLWDKNKNVSITQYSLFYNLELFKNVSDEKLETLRKNLDEQILISKKNSINKEIDELDNYQVQLDKIIIKVKDFINKNLLSNYTKILESILEYTTNGELLAGIVDSINDSYLFLKEYSLSNKEEKKQHLKKYEENIADLKDYYKDYNKVYKKLLDCQKTYTKAKNKYLYSLEKLYNNSLFDTYVEYSKNRIELENKILQVINSGLSFSYFKNDKKIIDRNEINNIFDQLLQISNLISDKEYKIDYNVALINNTNVVVATNNKYLEDEFLNSSRFDNCIILDPDYSSLEEIVGTISSSDKVDIVLDEYNTDKQFVKKVDMDKYSVVYKNSFEKLFKTNLSQTLLNSSNENIEKIDNISYSSMLTNMLLSVEDIHKNRLVLFDKTYLPILKIKLLSTVNEIYSINDIELKILKAFNINITSLSAISDIYDTKIDTINKAYNILRQYSLIVEENNILQLSSEAKRLISENSNQANVKAVINSIIFFDLYNQKILSTDDISISSLLTFDQIKDNRFIYDVNFNKTYDEMIEILESNKNSIVFSNIVATKHQTSSDFEVVVEDILFLNSAYAVFKTKNSVANIDLCLYDYKLINQNTNVEVNLFFPRSLSETAYSLLPGLKYFDIKQRNITCDNKPKTPINYQMIKSSAFYEVFKKVGVPILNVVDGKLVLDFETMDGISIDLYRLFLLYIQVETTNKELPYLLEYDNQFHIFYISKFGSVNLNRNFSLFKNFAIKYITAKHPNIQTITSGVIMDKTFEILNVIDDFIKNNNNKYSSYLNTYEKQEYIFMEILNSIGR